MKAHESIFKSREELSYVRLFVINDLKGSKIWGNPKKFCAFTFFDSNGESFNFEKFKYKYGTNLTHLRLIANPMGPETTIKIAREFKNLSYLNLAYNQVGLTKNAIEAITTLSSLTHLTLKGNLIDEFGAKAPAKRQLKSFIYLDSENNNIGPSGAVSIVSGNFHSLKSLNLERNQINDFGAFSIVKGNFKSLTHLNLACNSLSSKSMRVAVLQRRS